MTILNNGTRNQYTATSGQTVFAYNFEIFETSDLVVYQDITLLSEGTHYSVNGAGSNSGGSITLVTGAISGDIMTIFRNVTAERLTDYQNSGNFLADEINNDMDRVWAIIQQIQTDQTRFFQIAQTTTVSLPVTLDDPVASQYLRWKSDITGIESVSLSDISPGSVVASDFNIHVDSYDSMDLLPELVTGQVVTVTDEGISGSWVVDQGTHTENIGTIRDWDNATGAQYIRRLFGSAIDVFWFGASTTVDSTAAIQAAIDYAATFGGRTVVTAYGAIPLVQDEIFLKQGVLLRDMYISFDPQASDKICINIGTRDGAYLVRVAGAENCEVISLSGNTETGSRGFNIGHGGRSCFIANCRARMRTGPASANLGHIGFSITGVRSDLATVPGAYENKIIGVDAYACDIAYYIDTEGYGETGFSAQMNGNSIIAASAYACTSRAVYIGEGAQENQVEVRADTFVSSIGEGTTVAAAEIRGRFNEVKIKEEIGTVGDTQYCVMFVGPRPVYNTVEYSTQNIVTDDVFFNESSAAVGKNVAINTARPINVNGNSIFTATGRATGLAGATTTINEVQIDARSVLIKVVASNISTPATSTILYFAKNGVNSTTNRLTWDNADAARTIQIYDTDGGTSSTINSEFIYDPGDYVRFQIVQDASGDNDVSYTAYFKALHRN